MSDLGSTTVSIDDLRTGDASDLLAEADVVIAVDASTHEEEVVRGRHEWALAAETEREEELVVLRVELDMEAGDLEWLIDAIEALESGEAEEQRDDLEDDKEDDEE
jgi:hypothetical protein